MQEELGLTDEQVEKMREIRESGGSSEEVRREFTEGHIQIAELGSNAICVRRRRARVRGADRMS